jgi:hypothetical protein
MSAIGFGLCVGALVTATAITPRAFEKSGEIGLSLMAGGILAWVITPPLIEGFFGFIVGASSLPFAATLVLRSRIDALTQQKAIDDERRAKEREANQQRRDSAREAAEQWPADQSGWTHISKARMMHVAGQPHCYFMIGETSPRLRIVTYQVSQEFTIDGETEIDLARVISMNIASPSVTKIRSKTVPVTTIEHKKKSPIARGLVGGALLGPAGLVLGAASGLNSKVTSSVSHEKVQEEYETLGDPQLIIGTSDKDNPVLKMKFDPPSLADEWMYRIMGAQRR